MFCPQCSQEQISNDTRFCSRCGFPMIGVSQLLLSNGMLQPLNNSPVGELETPRKKGMKKGGKLMLLGLILVPLIAMFSIALRIEPFLVILTAILTFWGGLLRIIYAAIFESNRTLENAPDENILSGARKLFSRKKKIEELPMHDTSPDAGYIPPMQMNWRDTNELVKTSVTEETTKLLQKEK